MTLQYISADHSQSSISFFAKEKPPWLGFPGSPHGAAYFEFESAASPGQTSGVSMPASHSALVLVSGVWLGLDGCWSLSGRDWSSIFCAWLSPSALVLVGGCSVATSTCGPFESVSSQTCTCRAGVTTGEAKNGVSTSLAVFLKCIHGVMTGSGSWNISLNQIWGVIRGRCVSIDGAIRNHRLAMGDSVRSGMSDPGRMMVKGGGVISYGLFRPWCSFLYFVFKCHSMQLPGHCLNKTFYGSGTIFLHSLPCIGFDCHPNLSLHTDCNRPITSSLSAPQPRRFN